MDDTPNTNKPTLLTLAAIRPSGDGRTEEYLYNESQRIFTLHPEAPAAAEKSRILKKALAEKRPVKVLVHHREPLIEDVGAPSESEVSEFRNRRVPLKKPERTIRLNVKSIDPTTFNIVHHHQKASVFKQCTKIIPAFAKAKAIFDFCAQQSCNLPGPYAISPCIPFQYVIDGCYARAHKMYWVITTKYGYCCEKVFSFANQNSDTLAVQANKWGGCCVAWWYHVAPLVRVKVKLGKNFIEVAMVIDPGMFDEPVMLSTWLSAQENITCRPKAHISAYSIQPGTAYMPADYAGTSFTTDPTYSQTDATLVLYQNLITCP
jgi:hypothetical protein